MRDLIFENPMLIEVKRFWRRFFGVSRSNAGNFAVAFVVGLAYLMLLLLAIKYRSSMEPQYVIYIETLLFCLVVPSMVHGAIAGEREKRTWDLLAVAPITKAQIVVGKFMSAAISIFIVGLLLLVPALILDDSEQGAKKSAVLASQAIAMGYAFMLAGLSMLISAVSKRSFTSQAGIYGLQIFGLIVWPVLAAVFVASSFSASRQDFVLYLHPFFAVDRVFQTKVYSGQQLPFNGLGHLLLYLLLTILFLFWAVRRLQMDSGEDK